MELIELKDYQIKAVFDMGGSEKIIAALEEAEITFVYPDTSTAKGRKEIISFAAKFSRSKKMLDNAGKELSAYYMAKINPLNAERKKLRSACDQLVSDLIVEVKNALVFLNDAKTNAEKREAEAAELAFLRAAEEERKKEEDRRALEAAALELKAREEAEAEAATEAKSRADMAKHIAGAKAWWAEEARQKKLEAEAHLKNVKAKNDAAMEKIIEVSGISIAQAKRILIAIHDGDIPNVT